MNEQLDQNQPQKETAPAVGIVQYPEGITSDWIITKTKHLNNAFKEWFSKELLDIEENYKLYEIKPVTGTLPNGTTIPIVTSVVDTMTSRLVNGLVAREKFVVAVAVDPSITMQGETNKQGVVSDFINESIGITSDFTDKCDETLKTLMLENVAVVEAMWGIENKEDFKTQRGLDPLSGQELVIDKTLTSYELGRPDFRPVSVRMLAWDPRCKNRISESPWVRKRTMVSINELFRMQRDGIIESVDEVVKKTNKAMTPEGPTDPDAKQSQVVEGKQLPAVGWDDGVWELDEWWATLAWKNEAGQYMTGEYQFWIVGGDTVVKFRENPLIPQRKPFVTIKSSRKPGQLMAQGPVSVIKQMQKALNNNMANLEQLIKNASYSPTFYEPSSGIDGRRVSLQSNSLIPVLNVKGINRFEPATQAIGLIEKFIIFIIGQMREATAANEQSQGIDSNVDTLGQAQILEAGSNNRFSYLTEMINASMFGELAQEYFYFWKQFGEEGQMVVKDGSNDGKGYLVTPEDLEGCYIFKPLPAQTQQAKLQHFAQLKGLMQDLIQLQAQAPQMMIDDKGVPKKLKIYDFLVNQMLPLVNVQPRGLFSDAPPAQPMLLPPQEGMPQEGLPGQNPIPEPSPVEQPTEVVI